MSTMSVSWFNRSWDYISDGPKQDSAPTIKEHQDFINERKPNLAKISTPAQTFSLAGLIIFGIGWLFNLNSSKIVKYGLGLLTGVGAAATAFFGLAKGWSVENTNAVNNSDGAERIDEKPKAPKIVSEENFYTRLNYSDVTGNNIEISENGKKYARALTKAANSVGIDKINKVSRDLRSRFNSLMKEIGREPSTWGQSETWAMWDIGKQLYLFENQNESSDKYRLANPLTDEQLQEEIVLRMIGWEISVIETGENLPSYKLVEIGRAAIDKNTNNS